MSRTREKHHKDRRNYPHLGVLPDDLYVQLEPWPRIGRPPKHEVATWTVTDDWPRRVLVTEAEVDVFEAWFGDLFDDCLGRADDLTGRYLS